MNSGKIMNNRKHYRVKSRIRFFMGVLMIILLTVTATNTILGLNNAEGQTQDQYTVIEVCVGDTIWDIAKEHLAKNMGLRETVHQIISMNDISPGELQPGQKLKIPV